MAPMSGPDGSCASAISVAAERRPHVGAAYQHAMTSAAVPSVHLLSRLRVLEARVQAAVAVRRSADLTPDDPFRGLYISDLDLARLMSGPRLPLATDPAADQALRQVEAAADTAEAAGDDLRLRRLARTFGLEPIDVELLLVALAPDVDSRFESLYGYLHDDVTRRRASIGLALELSGAPLAAADGRSRLVAGAPLVDGDLLLVEETDRPFLTRPLRVPDRVALYLLGDDRPDPLLTDLVITPPRAAGTEPDGLARALAAGARLCYLRERPGAGGRSLATAALARAHMTSLAVDLERSASGVDPALVAAVALREARLRDAGLIAGPIDALGDAGGRAIRLLAESGWPILLTGRRAWEPRWARTVPLVVDVALPGAAQRAELWRVGLDGDRPLTLDPVALAHYRLGAEQVARATDAARLAAAFAGRALDPVDLQAGARAQNAAGLERLARRTEPRAGWDGLVLPQAVLEQLRELAARVRHRDRVLDEWGMGARSSRGRGITALFAGESGTGKTISAEIVAGELGLDLYVIDLSTVVDKYIGETEKNLDRIFVEAEGVNGVLLFDEADALFGKRSEVRDARDRYANVEVAYLLQRMELFDGMAILTTNLRANVDEAFTRRLDAVIDFPMPSEGERRRLWTLHLPPELPRSGDVDVSFLARAFRLSGGSIRNIALTAAFEAARADGPVSMADVIHGTVREYQKLGRLVLEAEFGPYHTLVGR